MTKQRIYLIAAGLILTALVLMMIGLTNDSILFWGSGLVVIAAAMVLSVASRWGR